jgi:hypothetical protein
MAQNLEVKVLFGPRGAEPIAEGNCVAAMRGGEEAGGKTGGRRTSIGYKACSCESTPSQGQALALFDPDDHPVTIDIGELERYDLRGSQAGG